MKPIRLDSVEYKAIVREFLSLKQGKMFTYADFTKWLKLHKYRLVNQTGNRSLEPAVFVSFVSYNYVLSKRYCREGRKGNIKTIYNIEEKI